MRGLIILILLVSSVWSGWWFIGTGAQKAAISQWMEQRRDDGWTAEVENFKITGFPNRFDSVFTNLELTNPYGGWSWQAPNFQTLALSYKPNHIIAVWPGEHVFTTANSTTHITSDVARGSLVFAPDTALTLARMQLELEGVSLNGTPDWRASASEASFAFFANPNPDLPENTYDLFIKALKFSPSGAWRASVDAEGNLPDTIPETRLDVALSFDKPWDRFAVEQVHPLLTTLEVRELRFSWGALHLSGTGKVDVNAMGYAYGEFNLTAKNWRQLLDVVIATRLFSTEFSIALDRGLTFFALLAGNPEDMNIPIRFADNLTYIGNIPIGAAPRFF